MKQKDLMALLRRYGFKTSDKRASGYFTNGVIFIDFMFFGEFAVIKTVNKKQEATSLVEIEEIIQELLA